MSKAQNIPNQPQGNQNSTIPPKAISFVPWGITFGLVLFNVALTSLGFLFSPVKSLSAFLMAKVYVLYVLGIPSFFMLGSMLLNKVNAKNKKSQASPVAEQPIQMRNAYTLGILFSCIFILWKMGTYS